MFNQKVYELHIKINMVLCLLVYLLYFENQYACNKYLPEVQLTFNLL